MGGFPGQTNSGLTLTCIFSRFNSFDAFLSDLMAAFLRVTTAVRCSQRYPTHAVVQQFCGEDERLRSDFCSEDIGGPLVTLSRNNEILVGIAAMHICQVNVQVQSEPALFTRVSFFRNWIFEHVQI